MHKHNVHSPKNTIRRRALSVATATNRQSRSLCVIIYLWCRATLAQQHINAGLFKFWRSRGGIGTPILMHVTYTPRHSYELLLFAPTANLSFSSACHSCLTSYFPSFGFHFYCCSYLLVLRVSVCSLFVVASRTRRCAAILRCRYIHSRLMAPRTSIYRQSFLTSIHSTASKQHGQ